MREREFGKKRIMIRKFSNHDIKIAEKFQEFINSLVEEKAQILANEKKSLEEEIDWLKDCLRAIEKCKAVFLVAEHNNSVVGEAEVTLGEGRQIHIATLGISVKSGYREIGLGSYLTDEIIELAKRELKPGPKIIRLSVLSTNKPAINLYKKFGFKKVTKIPDQIEFQGKLVDEIIMLRYLS